MAGHALPRLAAVAVRQDALEFGQRNFVPPQKHECPHRGTHHVAQKSVGRDFKIPFVCRCLHPLAGRHFAKCSFVVATTFAKGGEIALCQQQFAAFVHPLEVERKSDEQRIVAQKRRLRGVDVIAIGAPFCRETCVHVASYRYQLLHADVPWQHAI